MSDGNPESAPKPQAPLPATIAPVAPAAAATPQPLDLRALLLPEGWSLEQIEAEARRIYFHDLAKNPPVTPPFPWLDNRKLVVSASEGGFQKIFGGTEGWASYRHQKTGELDRERLRRAPWIRPILEMRAPKTQIFVNNHSMKAREFGPKARREKKRLFITLSNEVIYFISLVFIPDGRLALGTAFPPDGQWLRKTKSGATLLGPV